MERMDRNDLRAIIAAILAKRYSPELDVREIAKASAAFAELIIRASEDDRVE